ncbi:uncharacterized protein EDB91DRAFT_1137292 [Suillus paluster]|uniref:uncharacterized protein n=1 Tax=Suillus paluster TaxID=48578 RepID=UPI001B860281|nr:uncharacterized protein EDB91DRAFT_1137292 [Suillus paluster]KAG1738906.1 hypothetical protein EDB91DRAFT_1137292 [Suillus paluster]
MWKCNRNILYGLLAFVSILLTVAFVLEIKAGDTLSCLLYRSSRTYRCSSYLADGPPPFSGVPGCYPIKTTNVLFMFYVMLVIFEFVILVLVLIQARGHLQRTGIASGLLRSLYRDSLLYIVCLLFISTANVVVMSTIPPRYNEVFDTFPTVMHSVLASRTMFNLRQSAYCDVITTHTMDNSEMDSSSNNPLHFSVFGIV